MERSALYPKTTLKLNASASSLLQVHISLGVGLGFNCGIRVESRAARGGHITSLAGCFVLRFDDKKTSCAFGQILVIFLADKRLDLIWFAPVTPQPLSWFALKRAGILQSC
jgi:hypothetical protein